MKAKMVGRKACGFDASWRCGFDGKSNVEKKKKNARANIRRQNLWQTLLP